MREYKVAIFVFQTELTSTTFNLECSSSWEQFLAMNEEEEEEKVKKEEGKERKKEEDGKLSPPFTSILDPPLTRNASLILFGSSGRPKTW